MEQSLLRFSENYPGVVTRRCLALKKEEIVNMTIFAPLVFYYIILGGQIVNVSKTILEKY